MAINTHPHRTPDDTSAMLWTILAVLAIIVLAYAAYKMYPPSEYGTDYRVESTSPEPAGSTLILPK